MYGGFDTTAEMKLMDTSYTPKEMTILEMYMAQDSTSSTQLDQCFSLLLEMLLGYIQSWDMQGKLIT